ncbi:hypothetical protein [Vibrio gallaecicus]|nr:hypothetical protein [Vibrio gallaecicus]MDN3614309.1 hypothetical protein [Vibrio gallaecicus]
MSALSFLFLLICYQDEYWCEIFKVLNVSSCVNTFIYACSNHNTCT